MKLEEQLSKVSKKLKTRIQELKLRNKDIQIATSLALNSVKAAINGQPCNLKTLESVCRAVGWTLFDLFREEEGAKVEVETASAAPATSSVSPEVQIRQPQVSPVFGTPGGGDIISPI